MHVVQPLGDSFRSRWHPAASRFLMQVDHSGSVGTDKRIHDTEAVRIDLEEHRARTVTEKNTRGAIGVIDDRRYLVGADHDDLPRRAGGDKLRRNCQRVKKARARSLNIETTDVA